MNASTQVLGNEQLADEGFQQSDVCDERLGELSSVCGSIETSFGKTCTQCPLLPHGCIRACVF